MPSVETIIPEDASVLSETEAMRLAEKLEQLQLTIVKSRSEAIRSRQDSGIEDEWRQDEEFYEGLDEQNAKDHKTWSSKPVGRPDIRDRAQKNTGSTLFMNITRPYTEGAASRVGDMLIPTDDRAFGIKPTPIPSLVSLSKGEVPNDIRAAVQQEFPGNQPMQGQRLAVLQQKADDQLQKAKVAAEKAQKRIDDWHKECQFNAELRAVIDDCAKVGTGIIKGPYPVVRKKVAYKDGELIIEEEVKPASKRIDYWNFYPDSGCGEDIHSGASTWERDLISQKSLADLRGGPGYIDYQINEALKEGPTRASDKVPEQVARADHIKPDQRHMYEIWYGYLYLNREDLELLGADLDEADEFPMLPAAVTLVNNRVVRAELNLFETGEFPYDLMPWQPRKGMPWGRGVARQIRDCQSMLKGAIRNMMDNAGRAGGPQLVFKQGVIQPANGVAEIVPWKIWVASEEADIDRIENAFKFITIPMLQGDLERVVHLALRLAEITTGLPMLMQGQEGQYTPETVGGMQMLQNNSSSVLRRIARLYDDKLTEPHIRRYYTYILQYGEEDEKGDFAIEARGSSALVERDAQNQNVVQMGEMVMQPAFGIDPKKWAREFLKAMKFDPKTLEFDDEQWQQVVANMAEGPQDTSLQVAQLKAEAEMAKIQFKANLEQAMAQFKAAEADKDRHIDFIVAEMEREMEKMKLAGEKDISLSQIEAKLAESAMKLRTQTKLALQGPNAGAAPQVTTPPMEPAPRAAPGRAFQD